MDSDFSDTNPLYARNGRGDVSPPPSTPGSPTGHYASSKHNRFDFILIAFAVQLITFLFQRLGAELLNFSLNLFLIFFHHFCCDSNGRGATNSTKSSRDKKTNAEANKLRNHISMTEYEITRLTKSLRKRMASIQALENAVQAHHEKHRGDNKEVHMDQQEMLELNADVQSLHGQIAILTTRQQGLKDEYLRLTGVYCCIFSSTMLCHQAPLSLTIHQIFYF